MPEILNKYHLKAMPENAIMCDRTSKFGNPFKIGQTYQGRALNRDDVISAHYDWLLYSDEGTKVLRCVPELFGKDLVCWCFPKTCHCNLYYKLLYVESFSFPCPVLDCHKQNYFKLRDFCEHYRKILES